MVSDGFEPKLRAISFYEVFLSGICLIIAESLGIVALGIAGDIANNYLDDNDTNTEDDLESLHNEISSKRSELLVGVAAAWMAIPFTLSHVYLFGRVLESYFIATNGISSSVVSYAKWMYILCLIIGITLYNAVTGIFLFITSYYSWEFTDTDDDTSYTGYYIQFLGLRTVFAAADSSAIVNGIGASIPFILSLLSSYSILYRLLVILIVLFLYFDAVMSSFDWAERGFWSVGGYSNILGGGFLLVRMCFAFVCLLVIFACKRFLSFLFLFVCVCIWIDSNNKYLSFFLGCLLFDWNLADLFIMV